MKRNCGVLLPVASLPSRYGIGCFSEEAYRFIDFLESAGQSCWQILPLGQTGYGDSPYQSFSTFAGNPYFIDLVKLAEAGYITTEDADSVDFGSNPSYIDYEKVYYGRFPLLWKAYVNSPFALKPADPWSGSEYDGQRADFARFIDENSGWLPDYALYSAVKKQFNNVSYIEWDEDIRTRKPEAVERYSAMLADEIRFWEFQQYMFILQWTDLKRYANDHGIRIIGDIPIYVAFDSADTWSHPELFEFDDKGYPVVVAGCPPDAFSATGQLWGNPIYRWPYHKQTGYRWWISRIAKCFELYDVIRIDHFRGFDEYYAIPYGDETAQNGKWCPGPGYDLFAAIREALGEKQIIAEDLGYVTQSVIDLVNRTGYPNMKVLQFAFDSREESDYLPHNYPVNCVVYTGTHDNETMAGWYADVSPTDRALAEEYIGLPARQDSGTSADGTNVPDDDIAWAFIRLAFQSVARTAIIPMQDYLNLGNEARINHPSTLGTNWKWRLCSGQLTGQLAARMARMTVVYGRKR